MYTISVVKYQVDTMELWLRCKFYDVKSIANSNLSQKNLKNFLILVTEEMILVLGLR